MSKLFVGNLPFDTDEAAIRALFEQHGTVNSVALINDRDTGRPRGFGFVEMPDEAASQKAIKELNGAVVEGRSISVTVARPREERSNNKRSFSNSNSRW